MKSPKSFMNNGRIARSTKCLLLLMVCLTTLYQFLLNWKIASSGKISASTFSTTIPLQSQLQSQPLSLSELQVKWDHYPAVITHQSSASASKNNFIRPKYGILMGGTSDYFRKVIQSGDSDGRGHDLSSVMVSTCVAKLYAMNQGYAFKIVKNLENVSTRVYGPCPANKMSA